MTGLNPGCSEPRAPVAECVLSVCCCVSVWSWSALQFALQDLKIALATTPSVHPLFVLYCIVYYKSVCVCWGGGVYMIVHGASDQMTGGEGGISHWTYRVHTLISVCNAYLSCAWRLCIPLL